MITLPDKLDSLSNYNISMKFKIYLENECKKLEQKQAFIMARKALNLDDLLSFEQEERQRFNRERTRK